MSLWSAQQVEWLEAMGLQPLALASEAAPAQAGGIAGAGRIEPRAARAPEAVPSPMRLHAALLRCVRGQAAVLASLQVDVEALRTDPAAKRALWPRLRALRTPRP